MELNPMKLKTNCCSCGVELGVGSEVVYDKNYNCYCDNKECDVDSGMIDRTTLEPCWWDDPAIDEDDLHYDTSWSELMPVAIKIAKDLGIDCIAKRYTREEVYNDVVEAVKWYNKNKK